MLPLPPGAPHLEPRAKKEERSMSQQQTDHLEAFGHLGQTGGHGTRGVGSSPAPASSLEVPREGAMGRVEVGMGGGGGRNG